MTEALAACLCALLMTVERLVAVRDGRAWITVGLAPTVARRA